MYQYSKQQRKCFNKTGPFFVWEDESTKKVYEKMFVKILRGIRRRNRECDQLTRIRDIIGEGSICGGLMRRAMVVTSSLRLTLHLRF